MYYEVIRYFKDAQDNGYAYHEGDIYPREGHTVSDVRIKDLLSGNNFQKVALIKRVDQDRKFVNKTKVNETPTVENSEEDKAEIKSNGDFTAEDIDKMPFMKLKSVAKKNGIPVEDREAKEIRDDLKKEFGV